MQESLWETGTSRLRSICVCSTEAHNSRLGTESSTETVIMVALQCWSAGGSCCKLSSGCLGRLSWRRRGRHHGTREACDDGTHGNSWEG